MKLRMLDAIGPFFRHYHQKRINWSKIPFTALETESGLRPEVLESIPQDFRTFAERAAAFGYNAITLDDVPHLVPWHDYPAAQQQKIAAYRQLYRELFAIAAEYGLAIYLTMDIMFYNATLARLLGRGWTKAAGWLTTALERLFVDFPEIAGIVMRFGESDGVDVHGDFHSRLVLRTPQHARGFLRRMLPVFQRHQRLLIFRTWSVGALPIGDLMWNERTFDRVFQGLHSPQLVISMKYGESDFFSYLPLNPLFFRSGHQKIIEFQARREYEGFGAWPAFVGWDSQRYLEQLSEAQNVIGASVWCQTGGWGKRRQLTFLRNSSPWIELNTFVLARLCQGATCEDAIREFARTQWPDVPPEVALEFLRLADEVIKELLYVREVAERQLFFRRLRLPPQLFVFWDRVIINHTIKKILSCLVHEPQRAIDEGNAALDKLRRMIELAAEHGIPQKGLQLQLATFEILAAAREYFFQPYRPEVAEQLQELRSVYKQRFRRNYSILLDFNEAPLRGHHVRWLLATLVRGRGKYRLVDQVVTLRLLGWAFPLVTGALRKFVPRFAYTQAMGFDTFFK